MLAIVVGLTGVGKTTVIESAVEDGAEYNVTSYGDMLLDLAEEEGLASNRDELTELPPDEYDRLQGEVPEHIHTVASSSDVPVILDTHAALDTPAGYRPGLPRDALETLEPDRLVLIRADPDEIYERRRSDDDRDRDIVDVDKLREQQTVAQQMAAAGAVFAKSPLAVIDNHDGEVKQAGRELRKVIDAS